MSAFGGLDHPLGFFEAASERGVNAIAVTDLGSVQSYRAADYAGKEYGIKAIFGAEFYIDGKGDEDVAHRVVVLAKNRSGIKIRALADKGELQRNLLYFFDEKSLGRL